MAAEQPPSDSTPFLTLVDKILAAYPATNKEWLRKETTKKAELINKENPSYEMLTWFLAEADLHLRYYTALYVDKKVSNQNFALPTEKNIRWLAEAIANYKNKMQDLHWQLAERRILIDLIKSNYK
jgi:hypothetical protein